MITHHCRYEAPQVELELLLIRRDKAPFLFFAFNLMLCVRAIHGSFYEATMQLLFFLALENIKQF